MSRKIIVSLVSDQTIPNVLFIKAKNEADYYYFISTEKMESRGVTNHIVDSLNIKQGSFQIIEVIEDSISDIDEKLERQVQHDDDDTLLINITGGTKIMSLAVYNFFSRLGAAEIFYIPIGKNELRQIFPLRKNMVSIIKQRLNLLEYLKSYGVTVQPSSYSKKNDLLKPETETKKLFKAFVSEKHNKLFQAAEAIRLAGYRGKKVNIESEHTSHLFDTARIFNDNGVTWKSENEISKDETKYITGEWFEEYIYPIIKSTLKKSDDEIGIGLQLIKGGAPNEYDIMFTHNNSLYVIECKTDVTDNEEGKINYLFTNTLYKAATLKKEFGLWVNYYLFALNDFSKLTDIQKNRAKQLDIKLVGTETMIPEENFKDFFNKMK